MAWCPLLKEECMQEECVWYTGNHAGCAVVSIACKIE